MGFWDDIKEKLSSTLTEIKKNPYLDAVAKSALESIPVIGGVLVKIYENAPDGEEDKTSQIVQLLENLEKLNSESLEGICRGIVENQNLLINANNSLDNLTNEISSIHKKLEKQDNGFIEVKIGQTEIRLDVLKLREHQEKIFEAVKDVGKKVDLLYNHLTQKSTLVIKTEDHHIIQGSGYKIYCPDGWEVVSKEETEKIFQQVMKLAEQSPIPIDERDTAKTDLAIRYKEKLEEFQPNLNVVISDIIHDNFAQQIGATNLFILTMGGIIINQNIDQMTNIATVELLLKTPETEQYMIQKHYSHKNKHYIITIPDLRDNQLQKNPKVLEDLKKIVQSFAFI